MNTPVCKLKNVRFSYFKKPEVLKGIDLTINSKSCLAILGASGSGKSTIAQILGGFLTPSSGSILWSNEIIKVSTPLEVFRKKQMVFQDPSSALTPFYTPYKTLQELLQFHFPLAPDELNKKVIFHLDRFELEPKLYHKKIYELSGGEKQRLCLARAFCLEPEFLILDEPLSSCDPFLQKEILYLIKTKINENKLSVVIILHDLNHAAFLADEICLLQNGKIESVCSSELFINHPQTDYAKLFVEAFN